MQTSLSGILAVKSSEYTHKNQIKGETYGTIVSENVMGTRHDHFLNFHLDLDIDGEANSLKKLQLKTARAADENSPRKSYWTVVKEVAKTESEAKLRLNSGATEIIVMNPNIHTKVGNSIGYRLIPGSVAGALLNEDDYEQIRGAFTNYHVWVTPYNKSEKYAGGLYVDQSHGQDNLAKWTLRYYYFF